MNDYFCIGVRIKAVAAFLEFDTQLGKIVDFTIENNPNGFVFIENWLVPTRQINYAEAAHAKADASLHEDPLVVRPSMHNGLTHPVNGGVIHRALRMGFDHSCYSTHALSSQNYFGRRHGGDSLRTESSFVAAQSRRCSGMPGRPAADRTPAPRCPGAVACLATLPSQFV